MNTVETMSRNNRGTLIRRVQVQHTHNRVVELFYQQVNGKWARFKRQTLRQLIH